MDEHELRELVAAVKTCRVSRRTFVRRMVDLGLTAPLASQLLVHAGFAQSPKPADYKPTRAGGGGALRTLFWQAPTLLNPHFAVGVKDVEGAGIFYEPLSAWDPDGNLVPVLAAEISECRERRGRCRRHVSDLEAQNRRAVARWSALHRRRSRVQLGIRLRPGDGCHDDRQLPGCGGGEN